MQLVLITHGAGFQTNLCTAKNKVVEIFSGHISRHSKHI